MTSTLFEPLKKLDWTRVEAIHGPVSTVLRSIRDDPGLFRSLLNGVMHNPSLLGKCERSKLVDKIILFDDTESGVRMRLHMFNDYYDDEVHNHRFSFVALVLRGGYHHSMYAPETEATATLDPKRLEPMTIRSEIPGSCYALHHTMLHSICAQKGAMSLMIRGPALKQRAIVSNPSTLARNWHYGQKDEQAERIQSNALGLERVKDAIQLAHTQMGL